MVDYVALRSELDTDPLTRGYSAMDDAAAAADLNTLYRDAPPDEGALLQYVTLERFRTGNLYGRIKMVAETTTLRAGNSWELPPMPLGVGGVDVVPTYDQVQSAAAFMRFLETDTVFAVSLIDSRADTILSDLVAVGAMGGGDKTAIQALSQNQQSRATELFGVPVNIGDVQNARAL